MIRREKTLLGQTITCKPLSGKPLTIVCTVELMGKTDQRPRTKVKLAGINGDLLAIEALTVANAIRSLVNQAQTIADEMNAIKKKRLQARMRKPKIRPGKKPGAKR